MVQVDSNRYRRATDHLRYVNDTFRRLEENSSEESMSNEVREELINNVNQAMTLVNDNNVTLLNLQYRMDQTSLVGNSMSTWRKNLNKRSSLGYR